MDGLNDGLAISLRGPQAEDALRAFYHQIEEWDIPLPPAPPLVLDFGLNHFAKTGLIEFWIANEYLAGYCAKYLFVFDGQSCPLHYHRSKHETYFILKGRATVLCGERTHQLSVGDVLSIEPGKTHGFTGVGPLLLLEMSQACLVDDNYFTNSAIPIGGNYRGIPAAVAPTGATR